MQIGTISTERDPRRRLALRMDADRVLDVPRAADASGISVDVSPTLREYIKRLDTERSGLERLKEWASGLAAGDCGGAVVHTADVRFHPPIPDPMKFICVGKNYVAHLDELARTELINELPDEPTGFVKLNEVMSGHRAEVARPTGIVKFDYEPELVFVIGKPAFRVTSDRAMDHVFGLTLLNDLTAREIQKREVRSGTRFWTAKNMPGFAPLGPWIATLDEVGDIDDLDVECRVNDELRMDYNTCDQINKLPDVIEHFSRFLPLHPGDLFAMGSAAGVAVGQPNADELFLQPGDRVDVILKGVMTLSTRIIEEV